MSDVAIIAILVGAHTVGILVLAVYYLRSSNRVETAWPRFAAMLTTVTFDRDHPKRPRLIGTHRGRAIEAKIIVQRSGEGTSTHTLVATPCRLPADFALRPQGWSFLLERAFGAQDLEIGDPAFDRAFGIQAADEDTARAILSDPKVRAALVEQARREPDLTAADGEVRVLETGATTDPKALLSVFDAVVAAADALEHASTRVRAIAAPTDAHHWFVPRGKYRTLAAVMTLPLAFALATAGLLLPPDLRWVSWPVALVAGAVALKLILGPKPRLHLTADALIFERGGDSLAFPLASAHVWCVRHASAALQGTVLCLQDGDRRLAIGGHGHVFDDPRWYAEHASSDAPDIVVDRRRFSELMNALAFAMRRMRR